MFRHTRNLCLLNSAKNIRSLGNGGSATIVPKLNKVWNKIGNVQLIALGGGIQIEITASRDLNRACATTATISARRKRTQCHVLGDHMTE
jgi:hypothetical protein